MTKYLFGDLVKEVKNKVDRDNNPYEFFIAGDHMDTDELHLLRRGVFAGNDVGPAFIRIFKPGQVLYGSRRTYLRKVAVADFEGVTANTTFVLESKDETILLQRLLPFIMQSDRFVQHSIKRSKGSTNPYVLFSDLADYEIELPNIDKQRELADLLWAIDDVRMSYKKLIVATDELVKSQFIDMFGNLGEDEKGWGLTTLGKCCELNPRRSKDIDDELLVSFVPMPAVSEDGRIDTTETKKYAEVKKGFTYFAENDVLFAKITPCMENGKGCIAEGLVNGLGAGSTEFHVLRPIAGKSNPYWLYILTMQEAFRSSARKAMTGTGGQLRVPSGFLENYPITMPPIDLQETFEEMVRQSDKSKFELKKALSELTATYKRIIKENIG